MKSNFLMYKKLKSCFIKDISDSFYKDINLISWKDTNLNFNKLKKKRLIGKIPSPTRHKQKVILTQIIDSMRKYGFT